MPSYTNPILAGDIGFGGLMTTCRRGVPGFILMTGDPCPREPPAGNPQAFVAAARDYGCRT